MKLLVTGGAGFIGSTVVKRFLSAPDAEVLNFDKLTYAAHPDTLRDLAGHPRYAFAHADICDSAAVRSVLESFGPDGIVHLAAESHVDRSIEGPSEFVGTNIVGTYTMLNEALGYWNGLPDDRRAAFRFHHVSTDEVYGSLGAEGLFTEEHRYEPNSPYAASKASADHLARAWHHTFGLPVIVSNASNNYGPFQFPEKLIPRTILSAMHGQPIEVYGNGLNVRDWLFVEDHADALWEILQKGTPGETYNVGGNAERTNLSVVQEICRDLDEFLPDGAPHDQLITYVDDRPGHDHRYAVDTSKLEREIGFRPQADFSSGLRKTVQWYIANEDWWRAINDSQYAGERLGRISG